MTKEAPKIVGWICGCGQKRETVEEMHAHKTAEKHWQMPMAALTTGSGERKADVVDWTQNLKV